VKLLLDANLSPEVARLLKGRARRDPRGARTSPRSAGDEVDGRDATREVLGAALGREPEGICPPAAETVDLDAVGDDLVSEQSSLPAPTVPGAVAQTFAMAIAEEATDRVLKRLVVYPENR
jgi:hypothetical protein